MLGRMGLDWRGDARVVVWQKAGDPSVFGTELRREGSWRGEVR